MTEISKALQAFFFGFGWPAYAEYSIPETAQLPYITYSPAAPDWRESTILQARIWDRSTSYADVNAIADRMAETIGEGLRLPAAGGFLWLNKGTPFAQAMSTSADLKVLYININLQAFV